MESQKINQNYSNPASSADRQLPIIIAIIIFLIIIAVFLPKVASKDKTSKKSSKNGNKIEIIESDNLVPNSGENSSNIQSGNVVENLGASTVGEILGSESEELYGQPNSEKLLEGKDIKIEK